MGGQVCRGITDGSSCLAHLFGLQNPLLQERGRFVSLGIFSDSYVDLVALMDSVV